MLKKFILIIVINSLIFSPLILFPKTAQAQYLSKVIVDELTNLGIYIGITEGTAAGAAVIGVPIFDVISATEKAAKAAKETKSNILNALFAMLFEALRKRLLDMLVDQIINWIQGGGQPQFVTNWQGFLRNAAQAAVGDVVLQTSAAFLCSPFKLQVQLLLLPVPKFSEGIKCTLDDIVANIDDFYKDFEKGGWIAYNETWQPQNNYYGTIMLVRDEMLVKAALSKEAAEKEAMAGKGFLSVKRCKGGISAEEMKTNPDEYRNFVKDYKGNYCQEKNLENITPGTVVGEMASKAVGSDIDYILSAKELEQYVTAIVNAVINRVIKEGVGLIKGSSEQDTSGYTQPYEDALTEIQRQEKERIIAQYQMVIDDRNAVLANKNQSASSTQQLVVVLKQIKAANCWPPVSDVEIGSAESEVNRLKTEIVDLQKLISEIQTLKAEAEKISPDYRLREMGLLTQKYNEFNTKYSSIIAEVYSGSAKTASQLEAQKKQTELSNSQTRLATCSISP